MAGSASWNKHVAGGQRLGRRVQIQQVLLRLEHYSMLGFFIDLNLRMVRSHVALCASAWQAGDSSRSAVPTVAGRARTYGAVAVRFADTVALFTAAGHGRRAFQLSNRVWWSASSARLKLFRDVDLFRR